MRELLDQLKRNARFLTDANGQPTAIVLDLGVWQQLLALLDRLFEPKPTSPIVSSPPSVFGLIGLAKTDQVPPNDQEVADMLSDYKQQKYNGTYNQ